MSRARKVLIALVGIALAAPAAQAQFGGWVNKGAQKAKQVHEANAPWTPEQENAIGQASAAKMITVFGLYENPAMVNYVNLVGNTAARQAPRDVPYHFAILDTEIINAFALPGGYIFITRGALANMKSEAELAGTLAHEVAHVDGRHLEKQVRAKKNKNLASQTAFEEIGSRVPAPSELTAMAKDVVTEALSTSYSPGSESEADKKGTEFAAYAGYRATGLRDFLQMLARADDARRLGLWQKTHPPLPQRVATLTEIAKPYGDAGQTLEERFQQNVRFAPERAPAHAGSSSK
jgi:predicted Zn-dependent protease